MPRTLLTINNQRLQPALYPSDARTHNGKFGASLTIQAGAALGRKTSDGLLYPCVTATAIQTVTPSASATAGTFTISLLRPNGEIYTTSALAYNASIATIQTALDTASGVTNGVVASSAGSVAPMSNGVALTLTFSGTGYSALSQPLVTADYSSLTGATLAVAAVEPNQVQTITMAAVATAGTFTIAHMRASGVVAEAQVAFNVSLANLQAALDSLTGITNGIVAATGASAAPFSSAGTVTLTYSGTGGYAGGTFPMLGVTPVGTGTIAVTVDDTTITEDGTEKCVGFSEFAFKTDANSVCFLNTASTTPDIMDPGAMTMPYFIAGIFKTEDLPGYRTRHLTDLLGRVLKSGLIKF